MKTDSFLCVGCNKCIFQCPTHANDAVLENGENKIHVNNNLCIWCGECLDVCDHNARKLNDDLELFLKDLSAGRPISILAAPAIRHNIPEYKRLFSWLKSLGANLVYDVSFGADITVWGYLKAIQEQKLETVIAQPCPVVVSYIEHFRPKLIKQLAPVHSPVLCTAIYLKEYRDCKDSLAFLSPCISKTVEFQDVNTQGRVNYNVTYKRILKYLEKNNIDLMQYPEYEFDNPQGSMGVTFSRPGGLRENVRFHLAEDVWIKQVEGIEDVKGYLDEYTNRMEQNLPLPLLVDVLNCRHGCNMGTATRKATQYDQVDYDTDKMKRQMDKQKAEELFASFDTTLKLSDFIRKYDDKSHLHEPAKQEDVEEVFIKLNKRTERERSVNCFACGYGNCNDFATAVALGQNHIENCFQYTRSLLAKQTDELEQKHKTIISSLNYASKIQRNLLPHEDNLKDVFPDHEVLWYPKDIVGGDIYWFKNFADGALLCVCDCTGHGTPGALLTMLVVTALDAVVKESNYKDTAAVLWALDQRMVRALNVSVREKEKTDGWQSVTDIEDGADLALLYVSNTGDVTVSAGNTHVFVCDGEEVFDYKGQKLRIGNGMIQKKEDVKVEHIPYNPKNKYYIASDGLFDQIGDETHRPFGYRPFKEIVVENHEESIADIFEKVWHSFEQHRGEEMRRDDVALVGFKP